GAHQEQHGVLLSAIHALYDSSGCGACLCRSPAPGPLAVPGHRGGLLPVSAGRRGPCPLPRARKPHRWLHYGRKRAPRPLHAAARGQ
nr:hypothetical protein [Tanacetum cinerariifolium]